MSTEAVLDWKLGLGLGCCMAEAYNEAKKGEDRSKDTGVIRTIGVAQSFLSGAHAFYFDP